MGVALVPAWLFCDNIARHHVVGLYQPTCGVYAESRSTLLPRPIATELFIRGKAQSDIDQITGRTPLGRLGLPEDIVGVVSFLVGPNGGWISGQVLRANGGII